MLSLMKFHDKALRRDPLSVVFFGGSLTWGANASDPNTTSYRGLTTEFLRAKYPGTPIDFHDAAIGGTGSQLGMFRLERDVLSRRPDLVFLDFTVNDDLLGRDAPSLASYERIIRDLLNSGVSVMPVLLTVRDLAEQPDEQSPPRLSAHLEIARRYGLPAVNVLPMVRSKIVAGAAPEVLWPFEGTHPDDPGYQVFFEAIRDRFELATTEDSAVIVPPETLIDDLYPSRKRDILVERPLPAGWVRERTYRTSLWFDGLSSRWMGDVACTKNNGSADPLEVEFEGSLIGIIGEHNGLTPPIKVWIDGVHRYAPGLENDDFIWAINTAHLSPPKVGTGNLFFWRCIANDLTEGTHTLRIEPVWKDADPDAELRIESICSAGR